MINLALLLLKWFLLILLYIFLIVTVFVVYRDLKATSPAAAKTKGETAKSSRIVILDSPTENPGDSFYFDDQAVIGRTADCDIQISDNSVSHQHAAIARDAKSYKLEDLGSKNGTYLNQHKITRSTRLKQGDTIKVGKTTFEFME